MAETDTCFVLMPFGRKANPFPGPSQIDFDGVYEEIIEPAVRNANLRPLRADQEISSGLIHLAMFERLLLCEYAVADLTTANPNVYYELGIRHAVRPWSTVLICANKSRLPFDIELSRAYLYSIDDQGLLSRREGDVREIGTRLEDVRRRRGSNQLMEDSPLFTLLRQQGYDGPDLTKLQAKLRDRGDASREFEKIKNEVTSANIAVGYLRDIQKKYPPGIIDNAPVVMELLMAYRRAEAWDDMVRLVGQMPGSLQKAVSVQEQLGMALGRRHDFEEAEGVLKSLIATRGPTALTYCFLGVVRKLRLWAARGNGSELEAQGALNNAIEAFLAGFKLDPRMIFAGINTVLLMTVADPPDQRLKAILPVVRYFIDDAVHTGKAAFWEHAAALEMAVLDNDENRAASALDLLRVDAREPWMPVSMLANLTLVREHREQRGEGQEWYVSVENEVRHSSAAGRLPPYQPAMEPYGNRGSLARPDRLPRSSLSRSSSPTVPPNVPKPHKAKIKYALLAALAATVVLGAVLKRKKP